MAPMLEQDLEEPIKQTIQDLYEIQSSIHGYLGPTTTTVLIQKIHELTASLSHLSSLAASSSANISNGPPAPAPAPPPPTTNNNNNSNSNSNSSNGGPILIPPEIISYVDGGRNPDIYTREFVELVQRSNMFLKGKAEAFAMFRDVLAEEMVVGGVLGEGEVGRVVVVDDGVKEEGGGGGEGEGGVKMEEGEG